jgi:hypothetical protein
VALGTRFIQPYQTAIITGAIAPNGYLSFYITGTSTPAAVYSDVGLTVSLGNVVQADGTGLYGNIFLDPTVTYKVIQADQNGANATVADPVDSNVAAITAGLGLGTAAYANLGASGGNVPLATYNITWGGMHYFNAEVQLNAGMLILPPGATFSAAVGYLGIPVVSRTGNYTFALPDAASDGYWTNTATATIPANATAAFNTGDFLQASWPAGTTGTLAAAGGVTLRWPIGNVVGPRTVTGPGFIVAVKKATDEWWVQGGMNIS